MLFGSLRINLWSGVVGFILTFVLSVGSNLLTTSLIRGLIAFVFGSYLHLCCAGH